VAKRLRVAKSLVFVVSGEASRDKVLRIEGLSTEDVERMMKAEG
jgi:uncharacterized protein YggU (UPF0235/DUF167 family)